MCLFFLKNIIKDFYVFYNIFISFRCPQQRINKGFDYMIRGLFMNEIVKYHNNFNSVALKNFSGVEINLLMAICSKLKNKDINEIKLEFSDLRKMVNFGHKGELRFIQNLEQLYKKLLNLSIRIETDDRIINFVLFTKYEILKKEKVIVIKINEEFKFLLNNLINSFTRFELNEFISLKSNYSKEIYRRLKQFKNTGIWKVKIDTFRELLNIPPKYRMSEIDKKVLKIATEELSEFFKDFKILKVKKGKKIDLLEFRFTSENLKKKESIILEETKKTEVKPQKKYKIIENTPKVEEKEKTLSEQIKEELEAEQEALNRSTTLLGAYIAGLKDITNNSIIIDSKRRINLRKEKIEKLEQFSNLTDDEIDESLEKVIQKVLEMEIK